MQKTAVDRKLLAQANEVVRVMLRDAPAKIVVVVDDLFDFDRRLLPAVAQVLNKLSVPAYFIFAADSERITLKTSSCSVSVVTGPGPWPEGHVIKMLNWRKACVS